MMDVSSSSLQKRKRSSTGLTVSQGTEVDDGGSIKSRKLALDVVVVSVDALTASDVQIHATSIATSKTISPSTASISDESDNYIGACSELEKAFVEPTSAHKKILQRQWTAEAHGHVKEIHLKTSTDYDSDERSSAPTIGHKKTESRNRGTSTSKYNSAVVVNGTEAPLKSAIIREAPLPRAALPTQRDETATDALPVMGVTEAKNLDENHVAANIIIQGTYECPRSSASLPPINPTAVAALEEKHNDKNDDRDAKNVPAKGMSRVVKATASCLTFLFYCAALIILCLIPTIRRSNTMEMQTVEEIPRAHTSTLLTSEVDQPVFARSSYLLNQLSGLEQEVLHLSDILESAADVHAEAQVLMYKSREDEENLRQEAENSIRDIGNLITALEESSLALGVSVQDDNALMQELQIESGEEQQTIAGRLGDLIQGEGNLESALLQLEQGLTTDGAATLTPATALFTASAPLLSPGQTESSSSDKLTSNSTTDGADGSTLLKSGGVNVLSNLDTNRTDISQVGKMSLLKTEAGVIEVDTTILDAISSAEDALTLFEEELESSLDSIDNVVRDHMFSTAQEAYQRPQERATGPVSSTLSDTGTGTGTDSYEADAEGEGEGEENSFSDVDGVVDNTVDKTTRNRKKKGNNKLENINNADDDDNEIEYDSMGSMSDSAGADDINATDGDMSDSTDSSRSTRRRRSSSIKITKSKVVDSGIDDNSDSIDGTSGEEEEEEGDEDEDEEEEVEEEGEEEEEEGDMGGDMDDMMNAKDAYYDFKNSNNGPNKKYINEINSISSSITDTTDDISSNSDSENDGDTDGESKDVDSISEGISDDVTPPVSSMSTTIQQQHFDYAVWPRGGRVVPPGQTAFFFGETLVLTALPFIASMGPMKRIRYNLKLDRESADESVLISHNTIAGAGYSKEKGYSCYAFKGSKGAVTVTLHSAVKVSEVQILYSPRVNNRRTADAPKSVQLIGWTDLPSSLSRKQGVNLGMYQYNISDPSGTIDPRSWELQSFFIPDIKTQNGDSYPPFRAVTVYVFSNHGDVTQTRICRVRVLGELAY